MRFPVLKPIIFFNKIRVCHLYFLMSVRVQRECAKHRPRIRNSHCRSAAMTPSAPVAAKLLRSVVIIYQWWSVVISVYWADY